MDNNEELLKLERKFQEEINTQKRLLESKITLLEAKLEFEKEKTRIKHLSDNSYEIQGLKDFFNTKNVHDIEEIKKYYLQEIESTKKALEGNNPENTSSDEYNSSENTTDEKDLGESTTDERDLGGNIQKKLEDRANQAMDKAADKVSKKIEEKINQKIDQATDSTTIDKIIDKILELI